ncbi:MAG: hypothetical protein NW241_05335 [Bacteroidia bacterium]|nr:hypothetical protein [Bacteroidia bacterium]
MEPAFSRCLWQNFGAAIDMLGNAIRCCPDDLWRREPKFFCLA